MLLELNKHRSEIRRVVGGWHDIRTWSDQAWRLLYLTFIILELLPACFAGSILKTYSVHNSTSDFTLNHLVINSRNGTIYIGAVNKLLCLDENLNLISEVSTGPVLDHPQCPPGTSTSCRSSTNMEYVKTYLSNYNKILSIDYSNNHLIACGSVYQGSCEVRLLSNISSSTTYSRAKDVYYIAANDPDASTVGIITKGQGNVNVLFVGTTLHQDSDIRSLVPVLSTRQLTSSDPFNYILQNDILGQYSRILLRKSFKSDYAVNYISAFSDSEFVYFLVTQTGTSSTTQNSKVSKIIQLCKNDTSYQSYVEMTIECSSGDSVYNIVNSGSVYALGGGIGLSQDTTLLVATFSNSSAQQGSAVCVYKMTDLRKQFDKTIQDCANDSTPPKMDLHMRKFQNAIACTIKNRYTTCDHRTPLVGLTTVSAQAIIQFQDVSVTSSTAVLVNQKHAVIFLGTSNGHLKKVHLRDESSATEYAELSIGEGAINTDLRFDRSSQHIYVMTKHKISKMAVQDCASFSSCDTCRRAADPYCGWCVLEARCSQVSECADSEKSGRWLPMATDNDSNQCLLLNFVKPSIAPKAKVTLINLSVTGLPEGETYFCEFKSSDFSTRTKTTRSGNNINCNTPEPQSLPANIPGEDHVNVSLALVTSAGVSVLETKFSFYDCNISTCSSCTARWPCRWCIHYNQCTHKMSCPVASSLFVEQDTQCPQIDRITRPAAIPSNVATEIEVAAKNLPSPQDGVDEGFKCILDIDGANFSLRAMRMSHDRLVCMKSPLTYQSNKDSADAIMKITWNNVEVEMDSQLKVKIYKCSSMGTDCSSCLSRNKQYGCVWCLGRCAYNATCNDANRECPKPTILQVSPLSSPIEGGTKVTITGVNLGRDVDEILRVGVVTLAGIPCTPITQEYQVSRRIVCTTSTSASAVVGDVVVRIGNQEARKYQFSYQNPKIISLSPAFGPVSGGTRVTIKGQFMNTGQNISCYLGNAPCIIHKNSINEDEIRCTTTGVASPGHKLRTSVHFDSVRRNLNQPYSYTPDPVIKGISPLRSFLSGGLNVTVSGMNLATVQTPQMYLYKDNWQSLHTACIQQSNETMLCVSPSISNNSQSTSGRQKRSVTGDYSVGFVMDGVVTMQNLSAYYPNLRSTMVYHPDPVYFPFEDDIKVYKGEALIIKGKNLDLASSEADVKVTIGNEVCVVTSLSSSSLVCRPPSNQPTGQARNDLPLVKVVVGNLFFPLGKLEYQMPIPMELIIGISAAGGFLILVIIIILIIYKRKSTKAGRAFKKLQIQLDNLESNVRNECKQAFAELQTDITDLTSDLLASGIPYRPFKEYSFNVLFPGLDDHPVIQSPNNGHVGSVEMGLHQFSQLLNNKTFILVFIRTMESQKTFSIRDRAIVASLLMIILMDKMDYATEILKSLLNELIDKSVEKKHPKLMLRRTESVVEKLLSNWLSLCLYSHLKTQVGTPLFMLFKAIKHQIEKGPVDAVTSEARYSLSEDRLLRQKIEPKTLTINVETDVDSQEVVTVKVLDCDSITQTKEKMLDMIYKNTPYSHRPSVFNLDLEWRTGKSGQLTLQDEDAVTEFHGEWKHINTLAHYHVTDGATMALHPRQYELSKKKKGLNNSKPEHGISLNSIMALMNVDVEAGTKVWHLIKHQDDSHASARSHKDISEIFLTRLLSTKGTLQKFIDDLFTTVLAANNNLPPAVKFLFDFLDKGAQRHNITDQEVVHTWKSNSLPLRFWVNIIKNPDFVFDINKSTIVDSCLSVIAQTFMDSCSMSDHRLGKDSPTNKLLFAKDIPRYRQWVEKFYLNVKEMPKVTDQDMAAAMIELSQTYPVDFHVTNALKELYEYANTYRFEIIETLEEDLTAQKLNLSKQFEKIHTTIAGEVLY